MLSTVTSARDEVKVHRTDDRAGRKQWGGPAGTALSALAKAGDQAEEPEDPRPSSRRQWGGPANTALNVFAEAALMETANPSTEETIESSKSPSPAPPEVPDPKEPAKDTVTNAPDTHTSEMNAPIMGIYMYKHY